jgi:hypothetical protein
LRTLGENDTDVPARSPSGEKGDIDDPNHPTNGRGGASPHTDKSDLMSPFWGIIDLQGSGHDHRSPMAPRARSPDRRDTHATQYTRDPLSLEEGNRLIQACESLRERQVIVILLDTRLRVSELAPLADAGLTPYRGIKKLRNAGTLGPDRVLAVIGIGSLGTYAVQYAKLLSSGATGVAFGRSDGKLAVAKEYSADHAINTKGKSIDDIRKELLKAGVTPPL